MLSAAADSMHISNTTLFSCQLSMKVAVATYVYAHCYSDFTYHLDISSPRTPALPTTDWALPPHGITTTLGTPSCPPSMIPAAFTAMYKQRHANNGVCEEVYVHLYQKCFMCKLVNVC